MIPPGWAASPLVRTALPRLIEAHSAPVGASAMTGAGFHRGMVSPHLEVLLRLVPEDRRRAS